MNIWHDINPERISRSSYSAVIEISKGSKMKYGIDFLNILVQEINSI